jgi:hypothetical protein
VQTRLSDRPAIFTDAVAWVVRRLILAVAHPLLSDWIDLGNTALGGTERRQVHALVQIFVLKSAVWAAAIVGDQVSIITLLRGA